MRHQEQHYGAVSTVWKPSAPAVPAGQYLALHLTAVQLEAAANGATARMPHAHDGDAAEPLSVAAQSAMRRAIENAQRLLQVEQRRKMLMLTEPDLEVDPTRPTTTTKWLLGRRSSMPTTDHQSIRSRRRPPLSS